MRRRRADNGERGQAAIELSVVFGVLVLFTGSLLDVGRGFFHYTEVSSAARFGARWASAVGGTCLSMAGSSTNDWCNQFGGTASSFWSQPGNVPLQAGGVACPSSYDPAFTGYYSVGNFVGTTSSTIVGAIAQHFDSNSSTPNMVARSLTPGFDRTQLKVCIQLTWLASRNEWSAAPGDKVGVYVYYPFHPVLSILFAGKTINLTASAESRID